VVAVLGVGGGVFALVSGDGDPLTAGTADLPGRSKNLVVASGRSYAALNLTAQVKDLLAGKPVTTSPSSGAASAAASGTRPAATAHSPIPVPSKRGTVADPTQLQACLVSLGDKGRSPLIVDFAIYQGTEAAIIVLAGVNGGYDIWVVPRTCATGIDQPIAYKPATP
jgi:hypothetical protein